MYIKQANPQNLPVDRNNLPAGKKRKLIEVINQID
jgi:hypothetical protein